MTKFSRSDFCDATEIPNMAAGGHSDMAAVGNNKSILWREHIGCILNLFRKARNMICLQTPSIKWSFQDGRQLASKPVHHKQ